MGLLYQWTKIKSFFSLVVFFFFDKGGRNIWKKADVCHENNDTQVEGPLSHESVGTQMAMGNALLSEVVHYLLRMRKKRIGDKTENLS